MRCPSPSLHTALFTALVAIAGGCSADPAQDASFTLAGTVRGPATPPAAEAAILFLPNDYNATSTYKLGGGSSTSGSFVVELNATPPPDAYADESGLAIGWVALYEPGYVLDDGSITQSQADPITGVSARFAVIWKSDDNAGAALFPWAAGFPTGLSCGVCAQGSPDGYEPVACDAFEVDAYDDGSLYEWCNWTTDVSTAR